MNLRHTGGGPAGDTLVPSAGTGTVYRPDIDGLRAVAVLSVVLYHLQPDWLPGGFVGVDIFFVISGFLITRNIWLEMLDGRFTLGNFYVRRIRRIAPAFLAMASATLAFGALVLTPDDLDRLAQTALWGVFSASNVFFWLKLETSYFADSSAEEMLLHTWSLGVEEQFYMVWPLLLLLCVRLPRRAMAAIVLAATLCVLSYLLTELRLDEAPKFTYYMLPSRAGELMLGALLALFSREGPSRRVLPGAIVELAAAAGFLLMGASLVLLQPDSRFPGINALWPTMGAALVMLAGQNGSRLASALLSTRPMVFIGLLSYSLYLWHWPVLAYIRYFYGDVSLPHGLLAVIVMSVLAYAAYRWVEVPARRWRAPAWRQVVTLLAVPGALLAGAAVLIFAAGGVADRLRESTDYLAGIERLEKLTQAAPAFEQVCQLAQHDDSILDQSRCMLGPNSTALTEAGGDARILLWGDSMASHYVGLISVLADAGGFDFRNAAHAACPPVFAAGHGVGRYADGCSRFVSFMREQLLSGRYETVVMSAGWKNYDDRNPNFRRDLSQTIDALHRAGVRVVLIGHLPRFNGYNRRCELREIRSWHLDCSERGSIVDSGDTWINRHLRKVADTQPNITYLDARALLCSNGRCVAYADGLPLYFDTGHLSMAGSQRLGERIADTAVGRQWIRALTGSSR